MPTDKLDQLFGVEEIKAQQQQVIAIIDDTVAHITAASKQMRASELFVTDSNSLAQGTAAIKAATAAVDAHKASLEKLLAVKQQEQTLADAIAAVTAQSSKNRKDETDGAAALATAIGALNKERERLAAQAAQEVTNARNLGASYEQLKKQYKDASDNAKQLAAAQVLAGTATDGFNTKTKDAIGHAQNLGTQLNAAGAQVASYQNKVDACKGVSEQFNNMLGELPKLAQSPGEFIQALSGHIAGFAEQVVKARSEGQSWGSILTAIGGSFTGLPGIINLAVTALGFFTNSMKQDEEQAKRTKEAVKGLGDSLAAMIEKQSEINRIRGEANKVEGNTLGEEHKLELLKAHGATIADINKQERNFAAARVRDLEVEKNAYEYLNKTAYDQFEFFSGKYKPEWARKELASSRELIDVIKQVTGLSEQEAQKQAQLIASSINTSETYVKDFNVRINQLKRSINQVNDDLEVTLAANNKLANEQNNTSATKSSKSNPQLTGSTKKPSVSLPGAPGADNESVPGEMKKAQQEQLEIYLTGQKQLTDAEAEALRVSISLGLEKYKSQKQLREKNLKEEQAAADKQQKMAEQVGKAANFILDEVTKAHEASSKRKNAALDDESKKIEQNKDDQIKALDTLNISEEEKAARTAKINANAAAGEARIQGEKRRQMAKDVQFERESALAKALVNLYLGVSKEVSGKGVIGIATATAIFTFMSSIIGAITSVKTPSFYAEGTGPGGHKGGDAVVGEKYIAGKGYQKELVRMPGRGSFITQGPSYISDMPLRSEVIPLTDMQTADGWHTTLAQMPLQGGYGNLAQAIAAMQQTTPAISHTSVIIDNEGIRRIYTQGAYTRRRIETKITR